MALTPMMRQYQEIKQTQPDALLMFRLGDFYELFFEDAVTASRVLEITLTGRDAGESGRIPMCGVPYHAIDGYLEKLIDNGYRVAICEQVEDPKASKGLVQREVVRVVTPGTALSKVSSNRYLASVVVGHQSPQRIGLSFVDVNTGEVFIGHGDREQVLNQLHLWAPIEVVLPVDEDVPLWLETFVTDRSVLMTRRPAGETSLILEQYDVTSFSDLHIGSEHDGVRALATVLSYIRQTQKIALRHLQHPKALFEDEYLVLNQTAMHHLEITATVRDGSKKGSLFGLLDHTLTAAGTRLLKTWLERPLAKVDAILERQESVAFLQDDLILRTEVRDAMKHVHDLARIVARFSFNRANARDLQSLKTALLAGQAVVDTLSTAVPNLPKRLRDLTDNVPDLGQMVKEIEDKIVDEPPVQTRDGGMFREGVDEALDYLRSLQTSGRTWLRNLEQQERDKTGIKSLKVGYNKVFGYYIEVSKANQGHVPEHYERRQTLANAERFVLPELKEREAEILSAQERSLAREAELFAALCERVLSAGADIQIWADILAEIDVLQSLGHVASQRRYVRPNVGLEVGINIVKGRHPVVEALTASQFVANDTKLDASEQMILLTGPNMGGKSTYMRQTALIVLMAQIGSFVPAEQADIGIVDQIFARIGAADDLGRGQSTFMVEMIELAEILRQSTAKSLVLLDEIGRGTSTYDGLSIAEAVLEELAKPNQPLTMFATHYHELIAFSEPFSTVRNHSMAVEEDETGIAFLHTVVNRPSDRSYGIQVARLAGLPRQVVQRAEGLLAVRERSPQAEAHQEVAATQASSDTFALFDGPYRAFAELVAQENALSMTPLEAIQRLHELAERARELL